MTTVEYIRELYQEAKAEHGEDDPWTQQLRRQLAAKERNRNRSSASHFLVGSRARDDEADRPRPVKLPSPGEEPPQ